MSMYFSHIHFASTKLPNSVFQFDEQTDNIQNDKAMSINQINM
jgi:hypothetical protein